MNENLVIAIISSLECNFTTCDDCKEKFRTGNECPCQMISDGEYRNFVLKFEERLNAFLAHRHETISNDIVVTEDEIMDILQQTLISSETKE